MTVFRCLVVGAGLLLAACSSSAPTSAPAPADTATPVSFVNKVWRVAESTTVAQGTLYVFLSDGTLVITSANSKPLLGTWTSTGAGSLTMVEQAIPYRVDILELSTAQFRIRSHNPGEPVDITLVPAQGLP